MKERNGKHKKSHNTSGIYLFKMINENTKIMREIC